MTEFQMAVDKNQFGFNKKTNYLILKSKKR